MKVACRFSGPVYCLLLLSLMVGCGGSDFVQVSGLVTLDGLPLDSAVVTFLDTETEAGGSGSTNAEGKYILRVVPGDYKVAVSKYEGEKVADDVSVDDEAEQLMAEFENDIREEEASGKELIPEKYSNMATSVLEFTVPSGGTSEANFMNLTSR